jgi:hypothetical protein
MCLIGLLACSSDPRPAAEPAPPAPPAAAAPKAPAQPAGPVREPTPEELPVVEDFVPQAEAQIKADTFRAALDAIEKEMNAEL